MIITNFNLANNNIQNNTNGNAINDYSQSPCSNSQIINNYHPPVNQLNNLHPNFGTHNRQVENFQHVNQTYQNQQSLNSENVTVQFDQSTHFNEMGTKTIHSLSSNEINNFNYYKTDMNLIAKQIFDAHSRTFMCYIDYNQINQFKNNSQNINISNNEVQRIVSLVLLIFFIYNDFCN